MGMVGHLRDVLVVAPASSFHQQQQHHHHHEQFLAEQAAAAASLNAAAHNSAAATTLGVGVIPLLTAAPCIGDDPDANSRRIGGMHLWQNPLQAHSNYLKKPGIDHGAEANADVLPSNNSGSGIGVGPLTCQDCGNQAKKDCSHRRCRTCCRSRGFDCSTHVKSTWVPAARRRERQLASATTAAAAAGSSASTSSAKKPRLISPSQALTSASHTSTPNTTPRSFDTSSSHQDASFRENLPGHVRAPAVFKCVRVTAVDNGEDEYAYQAIVKIGGRVFKGFLYDQGVEGRDGIPDISDLHLGGPGGAKNEASSSFPLLDPSDVYAASGGGMLGGTTYSNPIN